MMQQFGQGEITDVQAIHALSASRLGKQYVFKSEKAVSRLKEIERLYLSKEEKKARLFAAVGVLAIWVLVMGGILYGLHGVVGGFGDEVIDSGSGEVAGSGGADEAHDCV